ncbi:aldo/keto reductase [Hymenobacter rubripertinctus]|uniref:Aldo/keto reductase n=1 Tax=Hymenobacter rubripertinctus TaxID=2029981 RepID=A0A418QU26_9BACT|nr:aldo/keto reductase [Hymenobacter rubripertinctus]RIY08608.1 aldo/keto reductase [Hymenobacter rubripertinctus]
MEKNITDIAGTWPLANGVEIPYLGLGVWQAEDGAQVQQAVKWALEAGYRHIDTASIYKNEEGVGQAVRESGVPRTDVFVTSKVWNNDQGYDSTLRAFDASLKRLGLETLDLYLIHWPVAGKSQDTWRALEQLYADGRVRAIGVSNFLQHHLEELLPEAQVKPMVNQLEFHPWLVQPELQAYCQQHGIQYQAWSPLMQGKVFEQDVVNDLAAKYGKSPAQILVRWDLQRGVVTIPKSVKQAHIVSNANVFDFELTADELAYIDGLDRHERLGPDPDTFPG